MLFTAKMIKNLTDDACITRFQPTDEKFANIICEINVEARRPCMYVEGEKYEIIIKEAKQ